MNSKTELRKVVLARRRELTNRDERSLRISERLQSLDRWGDAERIAFYIDIRTEVVTRQLLRKTLRDRGRVIVPYCSQEQLLLASIESWDELAPGAFGVLEPKLWVQKSPVRHIAPADVELVLVPGVAFDFRGGRLGYGKGYYDRLLTCLPSNCLRIGLAFECQLIERIPVEAHDEPMDLVVTEDRVIQQSAEVGNAEKLGAVIPLRPQPK